MKDVQSGTKHTIHFDDGVANPYLLKPHFVVYLVEVKVGTQRGRNNNFYNTKRKMGRVFVFFIGLNKMCGINQFPMNTLSKVSVRMNCRWILQSRWMTDSRWMWFGMLETVKTNTSRVNRPAPTTIYNARQSTMVRLFFPPLHPLPFISKFYCVNNIN